MYVQSDTLLLADVLSNFRNMRLEICVLDPAHFLPELGLVTQAFLKKTKVKLDLLTDIDMLLLVTIHWCVAANNKYMKNYDKNK